MKSNSNELPISVTLSLFFIIRSPVEEKKRKKSLETFVFCSKFWIKNWIHALIMIEYEEKHSGEGNEIKNQ